MVVGVPSNIDDRVPAQNFSRAEHRSNQIDVLSHWELCHGEVVLHAINWKWSLLSAWKTDGEIVYLIAVFFGLATSSVFQNIADNGFAREVSEAANDFFDDLIT